ncbi:MAG: lasso peptide biosynthesis B2 protein [Thiobacillus sp.]|nr:lasso peptide biosynthesis B2 protein [Thiobacillus sp.]
MWVDDAARFKQATICVELVENLAPMNRLLKRLRQWRALQPWERHMLVHLFFLLPATWVALRVHGFNKALSMAELPPLSPKRPELPAMAFAQRCAELTAIAASNGLYRANCLHQSLALCHVLQRHGLPTRLKIGVLPRARPFKAHAWVELDGIPLGQQPVADYAAFDRLGTAPDDAHFI